MDAKILRPPPDGVHSPMERCGARAGGMSGGGPSGRGRKNFCAPTNLLEISAVAVQLFVDTVKRRRSRCLRRAGGCLTTTRRTLFLQSDLDGAAGGYDDVISGREGVDGGAFG